MKQLLTDEEAAYAAICWFNGMKQHEISPLFGRKAPATASVAILTFLEKYVPDAPREYWGGIPYEMRKPLIPQAIHAFRVARGDI